MAQSAECFNVIGAATYVGVSKMTMLRALAEGHVPARRLGRRWVISRQALDVWLAGEAAPERQTVAGATGELTTSPSQR